MAAAVLRHLIASGVKPVRRDDLTQELVGLGWTRSDVWSALDRLSIQRRIGLSPTHCWAESRAGVDALIEREILRMLRESATEVHARDISAAVAPAARSRYSIQQERIVIVLRKLLAGNHVYLRDGVNFGAVSLGPEYVIAPRRRERVAERGVAFSVRDAQCRLTLGGLAERSRATLARDDVRTLRITFLAGTEHERTIVAAPVQFAGAVRVVVASRLSPLSLADREKLHQANWWLWPGETDSILRNPTARRTPYVAPEDCRVVRAFDPGPYGPVNAALALADVLPELADGPLALTVEASYLHELEQRAVRTARQRRKSAGERGPTLGWCGKCNRELTSPESAALGYGPECARKVGQDSALYTQAYGRAVQQVKASADPTSPYLAPLAPREFEDLIA